MSKSSFCRDVRSNIWSDTFEFQIIEKLSLCFQHHVEHTYSKNVFITFMNLCGQRFMKERTQWYPLVSIWMQHLDPVELPKRLPLSLLSGQPAPLIPNHYRCCHFCFHWPGFSLPENETGPARIPRIPEPLSSICGSNLSIHSIKTSWFYLQLLLVLFSFAHLVLYLGFPDFPFSSLQWWLSFLMHPVNPTNGLNLNAVCPVYSFLALDLCKAGTFLTLLLSPYFTLNRMF